MGNCFQHNNTERKEFPPFTQEDRHYGDIAQYQINGFKKLYGNVITEAHLLLKNKVQGHSYILMTEDYLKQVDPLEIDETYLFHSQSEILNGVKQVYYSSFDHAKTLAS